jgi:starch phosphorylase
MKAALNGVPSLSVLDGWWVEGHVEGVTGWAVGDGWHPGDADDDRHEAESLYRQLGEAILPCFYDDPARWRRIMRSTIALNGAFFNAQRMLEEYRRNAYGL